MIDANEYMHDANNERFTVVQIEDPEPLDELEEICALPGIDMIFFGPADFSQGIGHPNDFANPNVLDTKKRVAECARRHGKFAGTVGSANNFDELVDMGYTFINTGSDVRALAIYFGDILKTVSDKKIKEI